MAMHIDQWIKDHLHSYDVFPVALFSDWQTWQTTVTEDSETAVKPVYFSYTDPFCSVDYSKS